MKQVAMITFAALNTNKTTGAQFVGISGALDVDGVTKPVKLSINPGSAGFEVGATLAELYGAAYPDKSKYPYGFALVAENGFALSEAKQTFEDTEGNLREGAYKAHAVGGDLRIDEMPPVKVQVSEGAKALLAKYRG